MSNSNEVTMPEAIRTAVSSLMSEVNICLPGKIIKVIDYQKRKITVQPQIKKVFLDGEELEPPIIENVPLHYTGTSKAILHFPIEVGDPVIMIFSQRSLDNWLTSGKMSTPGHRRFFDLSDAIAIPGLMPFNVDHSLIKNNNTVTLSASGATKFTVNNAVEDLASLFSDLLDKIIAIQTIGSPVQHVLAPASIVDLTLIKTRIALLLEES